MRMGVGVGIERGDGFDSVYVVYGCLCYSTRPNRNSNCSIAGWAASEVG